MTFALRLKQAVVEALRTNPSLCNQGAAFQAYLKPMQGQDQKLADWKEAGIPDEVVLQACVGVCQKFVSTPENPRIGSWRYFDAAVRKAHKQSQEVSASQQADKVMAEVLAKMQKEYEAGR